MTVGELIAELKNYPQDMPVAVSADIMYPPEKYRIEVQQRTWYDTNYPWNRPEFEYINLE